MIDPGVEITDPAIVAAAETPDPLAVAPEPVSSEALPDAVADFDIAACEAAAFEAAPSVELIRKRRQGYPSETQVKRGRRLVHGDKELVEKLGRNDPCPCGSARRFKELLSARGAL